MSVQPPVAWVVAVDGAPTWVAALRRAGLAAGSLRWAATRVVAAADLPESDLVMLTSRRALLGLDAAWCAGRAAACVGGATAGAAEELGFDVRVVGEAGGEDLARRILASEPAPRRVLYLRGEHVRTEASEALRAAGVVVDERVTYATVPCDEFVSRVAASPEPQVVVVGSPRAAMALADALAAAGRTLAEPIPFVVPGEATADEVAGRFDGTVASAAGATPEAIAAAAHDALSRSTSAR